MKLEKTPFLQGSFFVHQVRYNFKRRVFIGMEQEKIL
jgi:hypothetical protein